MNYRTFLTILTAIVVILLVSVGFTYQKKRLNKQSKTPLAAPVQESELVVRDQPVTNDVLVEHAILTKPGFIAIHADVEGKPGDMIAHSDLLHGNQTYVIIPLREPLPVGSSWHAMIHTDDGDGKDTFPVGDSLQLDEQRQPITRKFTVTASP